MHQLHSILREIVDETIGKFKLMNMYQFPCRLTNIENFKKSSEGCEGMSDSPKQMTEFANPQAEAAIWFSVAKLSCEI